MSVDDIKKKLHALGFCLHRNYRCPILGRPVPFAVRPLFTGTTSVFFSLQCLESFVLRTEAMREWQRETLVEESVT